MLKLVRSIVCRLGCRFRSRAVVELENLALRHQLHVLRRQRSGRLRLFTFDRLLWVLLYRLWPRCLEVMVLVNPGTAVQWHRQGFRLFWRWRSRSGRPTADREIRDLIQQMSSANPLWGAPRIHGELLLSSASRSAKLRWPSTWCEDEGRLLRPGEASSAITPKASLRSTCSSWCVWRIADSGEISNSPHTGQAGVSKPSRCRAATADE